ncbi:dienelactone hydrolase [Xylogone sp. PMI_703]|nr:dienelactone hydrolase [Xylogone sp. PMI_703]
MASNPPARCCTIGVKHEGESTGTRFKITGTNIDAYAAEPKGDNVHKDVAIINIPDVIGIWQNSELITDQLAANGYYTIMPDPFNGDPISLNRPENFDFMAWLTKGSTGDNPHTTETVDPIIEATIKFLQDKGYKKIGAVGYCFGAKYVVRYLAKGKGLSVGYCAHPSFVTEEELANISGPLSIAAAEIDQIFTTELRHKSEVILKDSKLPYQINLFGSVSHGFAVRGDLSDPVQKWSKEQAFIQAVTWFDEHLA